MPADTVTPYSTVTPYATGFPSWVSDADAERLAAYATYQDMYWSEERAFKLIRRNDDGVGIYVPKPKMIVDTTAHYLLKGLSIGVEDPEKQSEFSDVLEGFIKRERFYSRFQVAKLTGVTRGDWVFHITADPLLPQGSRLSLNSVDPASYFPEYDPDDMETITGAKLVEQWSHPDDPNKSVVKVLRYWYEDSGLVWREENLWETEGWNNPKKAKKVKSLLPAGPLPTDIRIIPLYAFKNAEWDGFPFGNSELKGYERIFKAINQAISDEELALALVGLGVYATDAGRPLDDNGNETDWEVAPGKVWEMPGATMVKRLEGITSVTPVQDHVGYLDQALLDATGTSEVALGRVDTQTAESGIALALKFMPTLAKIEYRDNSGVDTLTQMWYDLKFWFKAYEGVDYTDQEIVVRLGDKLPVNRAKTLEELNNMLDRKVISRKFYRQEASRKLGYIFPPTIADDVLAEETALKEAQMLPMALADPTKVSGPGGRLQGAGDTLPADQQSQSNNKTRTNESNGTEANQGTGKP